ncbi:MAG: hypothetical protein GF393_10765 [Armatimonadia bacterium]|nr:hypothetical protein [Armatimonadia bacterium]
MTPAPTILDLCGGTGAWSRPYAEAGYDVRVITLPEHDVRTYQPPANVHGILAAPPCTEFASSGARWWKQKGEKALLEGLSVVDACLRLVVVCEPAWWVLENPVGRLRRWLGPPVHSFDPWEYGDAYTKRTLLWGTFVIPERRPCEPDPALLGTKANRGRGRHSRPQLAFKSKKMPLLPPSANRATLRAITPPGFARAFFEANP